MDYYSLFWGPEEVSRINEPWGEFIFGHRHSQFWLILARFMDYYSLFWGTRVILPIKEPWVAFTCRSSTLAVLADYGLFHGLLLTVLGYQCDFDD